MKSNQPNCELQALECRLLLAGDVTAAVLDGGDLSVRGDAEDNSVIISRTASGAIRIEGLEGTTVNGQASAELPQTSDDLIIRMQQGGEDHVSVQGRLDIPGDVQAQLGAGELVIEGTAGPINIGGNLIARTGKDGLVTLRNRVVVAGKMTIKAGGDLSAVAGLANVQNFAAAKFDNSLNVNNPYFPVVQGAKYTYEAQGIDDETDEPTAESNIVEVLAQTRTIEGVKVRIILDRVFEGGKLKEETRDFYAQDNGGNVWYFGEDSTSFEYDDQGNLIDTSKAGSWEAGTGGAQAGVIMEAKPRVGYRYYQEFSPGNVLDQGEGLSTGETATVPAGTFHNVFRSEEHSVVEPLAFENKLYAPGVGIMEEFDIDLEDDEILMTSRLTSLTLNGQPVTQIVPTSGFNGTNASGTPTGRVEIAGEARLAAKGPLALIGTKFRNDLSARSDDAIIVADSILRDDAVFSTGDTLTLRGTTANKEVQVEGNPDEIHILGSNISRLEADLGRGNNSIFVKDSRFNQFVAEGGSGKNTFNDLGHNTFGKLKLRRFTK